MIILYGLSDINDFLSLELSVKDFEIHNLVPFLYDVLILRFLLFARLYVLFFLFFFFQFSYPNRPLYFIFCRLCLTCWDVLSLGLLLKVL